MKAYPIGFHGHIPFYKQKLGDEPLVVPPKEKEALEHSMTVVEI